MFAQPVDYTCVDSDAIHKFASVFLQSRELSIAHTTQSQLQKVIDAQAQGLQKAIGQVDSLSIQLVTSRRELVTLLAMTLYYRHSARMSSVFFRHSTTPHECSPSSFRCISLPLCVCDRSFFTVYDDFLNPPGCCRGGC